MACKQDILDVTISSDMICKAVKSFTMSKRLAQAVIKSSILNIMYQRMVLNQADLKTRDFEGTAIIVFKRKRAKDPLLKQYLVWMTGIIDAMDKNYLKEVFMFMKNPVSEDIIETYKFALKYNMEEDKENERTPTHVRQATLELLQVINHLGRYNKLSEDTEIQMELTYFDMTPSVYEPPGFHPSIEKYCMVLPFSCNVHLGTLKTGFHRLKCSGGGEVFNERAFTPVGMESSMEEAKKTGSRSVETSVESVSVREDENAEQPDENAKQPNENAEQPEEHTEPPNENSEQLDKNPEQPDKNGEPPNENAQQPQKRSRNILNLSGITVSDRFHVTLSENSIEMTEEHYTCLCQLTMPLDVDVIECLDCKKQYHAPCHGYLCREDACNAEFTCIYCSDKDSTLRDILAAERPLFCRIRLILYYLDKHGKLPADILNFLSEDNRNLVMDKLHCFGVLVGKKNRINQVSLRQIIEKLFVLDDSQMF